MKIVEYIIENSTNFISNGGIIVGFLLVFIECFIPMLPLSVFVALNVNAFGFILGCLISWIATCTGGYICYRLSSIIDTKLQERLINKKFLSKVMSKIDQFSKIKFPQLVLIITLPFTPSFFVNILSGISGISKKKYIASLLIGKLFCIVFWGYIGKSLIESLTDIKSIIYIVITLIISYIISKIVNKKMNIE